MQRDLGQAYPENGRPVVRRLDPQSFARRVVQALTIARGQATRGVPAADETGEIAA
jgi:hypothetical protein